MLENTCKAHLGFLLSHINLFDDFTPQKHRFHRRKSVFFEYNNFKLKLLISPRIWTDSHLLLERAGESGLRREAHLVGDLLNGHVAVGQHERLGFLDAHLGYPFIEGHLPDHVQVFGQITAVGTYLAGGLLDGDPLGAVAATGPPARFLFLHHLNQGIAK